ELKAAKEKLTNSAQGVFTKMYENIQAQQGGAAGAGPDMGGFSGGAAGAGAGAGEGSQQGGGNDDVIDGSFREV
ncbi:MAG: molecular chaperone DnaK, partial [Lachnospiraceae bacterium]|nr:molecular chaperone DnaK [Lachnospiraceae bacterium]